MRKQTNKNTVVIQSALCLEFSELYSNLCRVFVWKISCFVVNNKIFIIYTSQIVFILIRVLCVQKALFVSLLSCSVTCTIMKSFVCYLDWLCQSKGFLMSFIPTYNFNTNLTQSSTVGFSKLLLFALFFQ